MQSTRRRQTPAGLKYCRCYELGRRRNSCHLRLSETCSSCTMQLLGKFEWMGADRSLGTLNCKSCSYLDVILQGKTLEAFLRNYARDKSTAPQWQRQVCKSTSTICISQHVYCIHSSGSAGLPGPEKGGWPTASRVAAPCDVPAIDTEDLTGLLRDPWTWESVPGSSTGGLESSPQLMFNAFDLCREVAFPEFLTSVSSSTETMNGSTEDS